MAQTFLAHLIKLKVSRINFDYLKYSKVPIIRTVRIIGTLEYLLLIKKIKIDPDFEKDKCVI